MIQTSNPVRISALCFVLSLALGGTALFGQETAVAKTGHVFETPVPETARLISIDEAVDLAIKGNLGLESSRVSNDTKKRAADTSWNVFIPTLSLSSSLSRDNKVSIPGAPQWHIAGSIQTSLNISAAYFESMKKLRLDYEGGLLSYETARAQLERDVRKSYYQMLLTLEKIELLREDYSAAEERVALAQANYRAGQAPELTLLQAQVAVENLKPTIDQAENALKLSMAQFAFNLGLPYDTQFELVPVDEDTTFIPLDVAELIHKASTGKPDIQGLKQSILVLQSTRKAQILQNYTPTLGLSWGLNSAFTRNPWGDNWFDGDNWNKSGAFTLSVSLRVDSFLPFSAASQTLKNLDDNIRSLNIGLAQSIRTTELEVYSKVLSLEQARTTVGALTQTVDLAERSYRLTETAYRAGLSSLLDVQNAEVELHKSRIGVLEQNFNYLMGLIDLEYAIGVPFGSLNSQGGV
jgi:outer membrane protein TolC